MKKKQHQVVGATNADDTDPSGGLIDKAKECGVVGPPGMPGGDDEPPEKKWVVMGQDKQILTHNPKPYTLKHLGAATSSFKTSVFWKIHF